MKLYNCKVAPDLRHNTGGVLLGRGTKEPAILRNCTNVAECTFLSSLRSGPVAFVSPLLSKPRRRCTAESGENQLSAFESAYRTFNKLLTDTNPRLRLSRERHRRPCTCVRLQREEESKDEVPKTPPQQQRSHSHCYLVPAKETFARIRLRSLHNRRQRTVSARVEEL